MVLPNYNQGLTYTIISFEHEKHIGSNFQSTFINFRSLFFKKKKNNGGEYHLVYTIITLIIWSNIITK